MAESFDEEQCARFEAAADRLPSLAGSLKAEQLLQFYAYYKQATMGKCEIPRPAWYNFEAKQKWDSWNRLGDMPREEAMGRYIDLLSEVWPDWEEDGEGGSQAWVSVSSMSNQDQVLEEDEKDIFDRVKEGDLDKVKEYSQTNKIDIVDEQGMGLLHWASDRGNAKMVECLIELNADIDIKDSSGQTPLHYASACGHLDVVKLLLDNGANSNLACNDGCLPIDIATEEDIRSLIRSN
jgi:acyl-CoA-binding protein